MSEETELAGTVFRERVRIGFAQELFLDENFDVGGVGACIFSMIELDRLHVLIAAKDELLLALALHDLLPQRHRCCHRDTENHEPNHDPEENVASFAFTVAIHSSIFRARS